ncbi:MAG: tetratricopeptide repeat protein [Vulcanimicrobiota bacterium]
MSLKSCLTYQRVFLLIIAAFLIECVLLCGIAEAERGERRWAVIVGINEYMKEVTPLHCAVNDALTFRTVLVEKAGFKESDVFLLTSNAGGNRIPDKSNIIRWISYIKAQANAQDTVVFFFSGHGMDSGDESYLLTYEADPYSKATLDASSLKVSDLRKIIEEMPTGRILLFVDACRNDPRSGKGETDNTLTAGQSQNLSISSGYSPDINTGGNFTLTFFSCKVGQRSYEWSEQKLGFFTYYLTKGIGGDKAAIDENGNVTLGLLKNYLGREVSGAVKRERGETIRQEPWVTGDSSADADLWAISHRARVLTNREMTVSHQGPLSENEKAERLYLEGDDHYYTMKGYFDLGYTRTAIAELKKSYDAYTEAIQLNPRFSEAYSSRGVLMGESGEYELALKDCSRALELNPHSAQAYNNRAAVEYRMEEYDKAIDDCTKAVQLDPELITAYNIRGYVHMKRGSLEKAIGDFTRVLKIDSKRSTAYDYRGRVYHQKGEFDRAIEDFTKAVEYRPRYMPGYFDRSIAYLSKGLYQKAVSDCDRALALNPNYAEAYHLKAQALEKMGRNAEASEALNKYRQLTSKSPTDSGEKSRDAAPDNRPGSNSTDSRLKELEEKLKKLEGR